MAQRPHTLAVDGAQMSGTATRGPQHNAAIWYAQDGFDPAAKGINGRRVAGESFLKGLLRHGDVDEFVLLSKSADDVIPKRTGIPPAPPLARH